MGRISTPRGRSHEPADEVATSHPANRRSAPYSPASSRAIGDYPGLRALAWQTDAGTTITETEALNLYERSWRHLNQEALTDGEKAFIQHLEDTYSNGRLLV